MFDRLARWLIRKPSAWRPRNRSPNGPGRPLKRAVENLPGASVKNGLRSANHGRRRPRSCVVRLSCRTSTRCRISMKSSFLESSRRALQLPLNRRIQGRRCWTELALSRLRRENEKIRCDDSRNRLVDEGITELTRRRWREQHTSLYCIVVLTHSELPRGGREEETPRFTGAVAGASTVHVLSRRLEARRTTQLPPVAFAAVAGATHPAGEEPRPQTDGASRPGAARSTVGWGGRRQPASRPPPRRRGEGEIDSCRLRRTRGE